MAELIIKKEDLIKEGIIPETGFEFPEQFQPLEQTQPLEQLQPPEQPKTIGGFLENVIKSGARAVEGFAEMIFHPVETIKTIGKTAIGTAELLIPGEQGLEEYPRTIGRVYAERYGSPEKIAKTLYEDPVGALLDIATLAGGISGLGKGLIKAGELSKIGTLGKVGRIAEATGEALKPSAIISKATEPLKSVSGAVKEASPLLKTISEPPIKSSVAKVASGLTGVPTETYINLLDKSTRPKVIRGIIEDTSILDEIYKNYTSAINKYKNVVGKEYETTLNRLSNTYKLSQFRKQIKNEVINNLVDTLSRAGIKVKLSPDNRIISLNFKNSIVAGAPHEQNTIKRLVDLVQNQWTAYGSLKNLERLERNIRDLLENSIGKFVKSTGKSPKFIDALNVEFVDKIRNVITKYVPEYEELLKHPYRNYKMLLEPKLENYLGLNARGSLSQELAKQNLVRLFSNSKTANAVVDVLKQLEDELISRGLLKESQIPELTGLWLNPKFMSGKEGYGIGIFTQTIRGFGADWLSWLIRALSTPEMKTLYNVLKKSGIPAERVIDALLFENQ